MPSESSLAALASVSAVVCAMLFAPDVADAHHVVSSYGIAPAEPLTRTELEFEFREFDFGSEATSGTSQIGRATVEYAPWAWLSGSGTLPFGHVAYDTGRGETGLGDLTLALRGRFIATEHGELILSGGLGAELPTGDEEAGLGSGHAELVPFLVVSSAVSDDVVLFGTVIHQASLEGGGHSDGGDGHHQDGHGGHDHGHAHDDSGQVDDVEVHGSIIGPHADQETKATLGGAYIFDPLYTAVRVMSVFAWTRHDGAEHDVFGPVEATAEVGWKVMDQLSLAAAFDAPIIGPDRYKWKGRVSAAWTF